MTHSTHQAPRCRICLGPHDTYDCEELPGSDPHYRRLGCLIMIVMAVASWTLIYWLTTSGILDAIDAWRAPWQ